MSADGRCGHCGLAVEIPFDQRRVSGMFPCSHCKTQLFNYVPGSPVPPRDSPDSAPYLRLYKHAGTWVSELWMGDVGSRRSSAYDEFKGTYVGSDTAGDALTRGLEMLEAQTTKENRT